MVSFLSCLFPPPRTSKLLKDETYGLPPHVGQDALEGAPDKENRDPAITPTKTASPPPASVLATAQPSTVPLPVQQLTVCSSPSHARAPSFSLQQQLIGIQAQIKLEQAVYPWGRDATCSSTGNAGATLACARSRQEDSLDAVASRVIAILRLGSTPSLRRRDDRAEPHPPRSGTARPKSATDMQEPAGTKAYKPSQASTLSGSRPSSGKVQALINSVRESSTTSRQPSTTPRARSARDLNAPSGACAHVQLPAQQQVKASISICGSGAAAKLLQLFPEQPLPEHAANPLQLQLALLQRYKLLQLQEDKAGHHLRWQQVHRSKSMADVGSSSIVRRCVTQLPS